MAAVHGKLPGGQWSSIQARTWATLQVDSWYAIESIGDQGGSSSAIVTGRLNVRAAITAVASATATVAGRLLLRGTATGSGASSMTAHGEAINVSHTGQHVELMTGRQESVVGLLVHAIKDALPNISIRAS